MKVVQSQVPEDEDRFYPATICGNCGQSYIAIRDKCAVCDSSNLQPLEIDE